MSQLSDKYFLDFCCCAFFMFSEANNACIHFNCPYFLPSQATNRYVAIYIFKYSSFKWILWRKENRLYAQWTWSKI